jgi:uncharacterized protein
MMNLGIANLPIIDTHEHLVDESYRVDVEKDVLSMFLRHYLSTDLANAGIAIERIQAIRDPEVKIEKRWSELEPFWKRVSHTAYAQALKIAVRDLYQVDQINQETIGEIAARVEESSKPGLYSNVFQKAGIEFAVVNDLGEIYDPNTLYDTPFPRPSDPPGLFKKVIHGSPLIVLRNKLQILHMQDVLGSHPIHTLQDWLDVITQVFNRADRAVALKLPYAYNSSLAVSKATIHDAEMVFNQLIGAAYPDESLSHAALQPLTDYLVHYTVRQASQRGLPIQIHTGLLEGSYNNLQNANPMHLIPLLMEYREARFVLFHGSYPWIREFIALGKMFPNVWLDMCWVWIISPQAGRFMLHEAIETIPQNKLTAFGGDYIFIEGSYGHSVMARQNIARVLVEKIAEGWFGTDEAVQYARAVLYDNALELYGRPE